MPFEIYCDFDGTITTRDAFDYLLECLAHSDWKAIEEQWERGEISARQCMGRQVALIGHPWSKIVDTLQAVPIDPTFAPFAKWCTESGIKLYVVSDGPDKAIEHMLNREGVRVDSIIANHLAEDDQGRFALEFPYGENDCPAGVCKCKVLERAGNKVTRVVIGDGQSDFCWAKGADVVFAKKKLLDYCRKEGIAHLEFVNFDSIRLTLESKMGSACGLSGK